MASPSFPLPFPPSPAWAPPKVGGRGAVSSGSDLIGAFSPLSLSSNCQPTVGTTLIISLKKSNGDPISYKKHLSNTIQYFKVGGPGRMEFGTCRFPTEFTRKCQPQKFPPQLSKKSHNTQLRSYLEKQNNNQEVWKKGSLIWALLARASLQRRPNGLRAANRRLWIPLLEFSPSMVVRFYISSIPHVT